MAGFRGQKTLAFYQIFLQLFSSGLMGGIAAKKHLTVLLVWAIRVSRIMVKCWATVFSS